MLVAPCVSRCLLDVAIVKLEGETPGNAPVLVPEDVESDNIHNPIEGKLIDHISLCP